MGVTLVFHIIAGSLALISGFVALYVTKGITLHRRAGIVFVFAMLAMAFAGLAIAIGRGVAPSINVPAALVTASFVVTALTTVRPPSPAFRRLDFAATLVLAGVAAVTLAFVIVAIASGGQRKGMPVFPFFMFGIPAMLAVAGDIRVLRSGPLRGAARLTRHLWRMSFALLIAALSFFIGQAKVFPEPIRIRPLLALPVLAVLVTMLYWLWRIRVRKSLKGIVQSTVKGNRHGRESAVHEVLD